MTTDIERWLAERGTVECAPYSARITPEACATYAARGDRIYCPCANRATGAKPLEKRTRAQKPAVPKQLAPEPVPEREEAAVVEVAPAVEPIDLDLVDRLRRLAALGHYASALILARCGIDQVPMGPAPVRNRRRKQSRMVRQDSRGSL